MVPFLITKAALFYADFRLQDVRSGIDWHFVHLFAAYGILAGVDVTASSLLWRGANKTSGQGSALMSTNTSNCALLRMPCWNLLRSDPYPAACTRVWLALSLSFSDRKNWMNMALWREYFRHKKNFSHTPAKNVYARAWTRRLVDASSSCFSGHVCTYTCVSGFFITPAGVGWDGMGWGGMGWDGMGWGGMGWDGMGWDGMGWDGMGWDGMGWDGMGWEEKGKWRRRNMTTVYGNESRRSVLLHILLDTHAHAHGE